MNNRRRRINYSVKKEMQIRILGKVFFIIFTGIVMVSAVFYYYSNIKIGGAYKQFHVQAKNFLDYLLPAVVAAGTMGAISAAALAIFLPHKIAGPLHRMERILKENLGEGDLTVQFHPRKGDEVRELADVLNVATEKLRGRIMEIDKNALELEGFVMSLVEREKNAGLPPDAEKRLRELTIALRTSIKHFKT